MDSIEKAFAEHVMAALEVRMGGIRDDLRVPALIIAEDFGRLMAMRLTGSDVERELAHTKAHIAGLKFEGAVMLRNAMRETVADVLAELGKIGLSWAGSG